METSIMDTSGMECPCDILMRVSCSSGGDHKTGGLNGRVFGRYMVFETTVTKETIL